MNPNRPPFFPGGPNGGMMAQQGFDPVTGAMSADGSRAGSESFGQESGGRFPDSGRGARGGRGSLRGVRGGRGRGGSSHPYSAGRFAGATPAKNSLVVEHIPDEFNTIDKVNEFFKQFGSLTNIQVDQPAHKALIQYSSNEEAKAAYNSPEVIFGNRFVKVYWQPDDLNADTFGVPQPKPTGQVRPEASATGMAHRHQPFSQPPQPPLTSVLMTPERAAELAAERAAAAAKLAENKKTMMEIQRQKEALIQRQQEEQRLLHQKLFANKSMSQQDKDELLKGLKNVAMEVTKEIVNPLAQAQAAVVAAEAKRQAEHQSEIERLEKEKLDRELEGLNGVTDTGADGAAAATAAATTPATDAAQTTAALKAKLAALQAQVHGRR
jgi:RNA-binding protein 26